MSNDRERPLCYLGHRGPHHRHLRLGRRSAQEAGDPRPCTCPGNL